MIRTLSAAAVAAIALATPALADTATTTQKVVLSQTAQSLEARQHLIRQGYVNVSDLQPDADGRWTGTATKDGKTVIVAINIGRPAGAVTN